MFKIIGVLRSMVLTVQSPLQVIPQMFDWIKIRRKCWPCKNLDVALLKKLLSVSGCVSSCVVLLKNNISMHGGVRHHVSLKHTLHVCLRIYRPSIVEKNWPNPIIVRDSTPHHQRCSTPPAVFPNAICLVSFTASSPYTYMAISMVNAESKFATEYDTSPLDAISRGMFRSPQRTLVSVNLCQDGADLWATSTYARGR
ncbi:hypothetical protein ElyMa_003649600 [Elysia marginata]|uniref:Uncharacterized protein n=1 Tax=Elysia marginata TaxID=1093978 RepID=A0AAV4EWU2_9GAST|nr:hypothetical protein ElyMa_003649600 [Elysia marginata]